MNILIRSIAIACVCATLSGCFGPTPYQVRAYNGGYDDRTVSGERHFVAFYGNGFTSREAVLKYWLYRCAEVTSKNGFDYFVLLAKAAPKPSAALDAEPRDAFSATVDVRLPDTGETVQAKGAATGGSVPIYIPGGGGTVTRWSASGVIQMYKGEPLELNPVTFVVKELLEKLGPEIRAGVVPGQGYKLPDPASATTTAENESAAPAPGGAVKLDDLKDLLPE
jgi:hypothetical protein